MKFHASIFPRPENGAKTFRAKYGSTCRRCNNACKVGDLVIYDKCWSMSEHTFYQGVVHASCFPDIMNDFYKMRTAVYALYACLGLEIAEIKQDWKVKLIPMYIHQVWRPVVIGKRPNGKQKNICFDGSVFVSLKTNKQLTIIHKNSTAYVYDPSAKGQVVQFAGHPMLTSSWKPLSQEEARNLWFGHLEMQLHQLTHSDLLPGTT